MAIQINWLNATPSWGKEVAEHPDTSIEALRELARHADVEVRVAVAEHRSTLLETVIVLAQDESVDLRYAIAENHNTHGDVLDILTHDENPFIAHRAQKTLRHIRGGSIVVFPVVNPRPLLIACTSK